MGSVERGAEGEREGADHFAAATAPFAVGRDRLLATLPLPTLHPSIAMGSWCAGWRLRDLATSPTHCLLLEDLVAVHCSSSSSGSGSEDPAITAYLQAFTRASTVPDLLQILLLALAPPWRAAARDASAAHAATLASEAFGEEGTMLLRNLNAGLWRPAAGSSSSSSSGVLGSGPRLTPSALAALAARGGEARLQSARMDSRSAVIELLSLCIRHSPLLGTLEMAAFLAADAVAFFAGAGAGGGGGGGGGAHGCGVEAVAGGAAFAQACVGALRQQQGGGQWWAHC